MPEFLSDGRVTSGRTADSPSNPTSESCARPKQPGAIAPTKELRRAYRRATSAWRRSAATGSRRPREGLLHGPDVLNLPLLLDCPITTVVRNPCPVQSALSAQAVCADLAGCKGTPSASFAMHDPEHRPPIVRRYGPPAHRTRAEPRLDLPQSLGPRKFDIPNLSPRDRLLKWCDERLEVLLGHHADIWMGHGQVVQRQVDVPLAAGNPSRAGRAVLQDRAQRRDLGFHVGRAIRRV